MEKNVHITCLYAKISNYHVTVCASFAYQIRILVTFLTWAKMFLLAIFYFTAIFLAGSLLHFLPNHCGQNLPDSALILIGVIIAILIIMAIMLMMLDYDFIFNDYGDDNDIACAMFPIYLTLCCVTFLYIFMLCG